MCDISSSSLKTTSECLLKEEKTEEERRKTKEDGWLEESNVAIKETEKDSYLFTYHKEIHKTDRTFTFHHLKKIAFFLFRSLWICISSHLQYPIFLVKIFRSLSLIEF